MTDRPVSRPAALEGPEHGHTWRITVDCRGASSIHGQPGSLRDDPSWDENPRTVLVRAHSLAAAFRKAARLPFPLLMGEPIPTHPFESFDGASGYSCTAMVMRDGGGDQCGLPAGVHPSRELVEAGKAHGPCYICGAVDNHGGMPHGDYTGDGQTRENHAPCCAACGGAGATISGPCSDCYGTGHTHPTAELAPRLEAAIEAGVADETIFTPANRTDPLEQIQQAGETLRHIREAAARHGVPFGGGTDIIGDVAPLPEDITGHTFGRHYEHAPEPGGWRRVCAYHNRLGIWVTTWPPARSPDWSWVQCTREHP
jgi:hypothetical protein